MPRDTNIKLSDLELQAQKQLQDILSRPRIKGDHARGIASAHAIRQDVENYIREFNVPYITI